MKRNKEYKVELSVQDMKELSIWRPGHLGDEEPSLSHGGAEDLT